MIIPIWFIAWIILIWISKIENKGVRITWYILFAIVAIIVLIAMDKAGYKLRFR